MFSSQPWQEIQPCIYHKHVFITTMYSSQPCIYHNHGRRYNHVAISYLYHNHGGRFEKNFIYLSLSVVTPMEKCDNRCDFLTQVYLGVCFYVGVCVGVYANQCNFLTQVYLGVCACVCVCVCVCVYDNQCNFLTQVYVGVCANTTALLQSPSKALECILATGGNIFKHFQPVQCLCHICLFLLYYNQSLPLLYRNNPPNKCAKLELVNG